MVSPAACWLAALSDGWPLWRWMARAGAAPVRLRGMVFLRGPARLVSPAPARLAALADGGNDGAERFLQALAQGMERGDDE